MAISTWVTRRSGTACPRSRASSSRSSTASPCRSTESALPTARTPTRGCPTSSASGYASVGLLRRRLPAELAGGQLLQAGVSRIEGEGAPVELPRRSPFPPPGLEVAEQAEGDEVVRLLAQPVLELGTRLGVTPQALQRSRLQVERNDRPGVEVRGSPRVRQTRVRGGDRSARGPDI